MQLGGPAPVTSMMVEWRDRAACRGVTPTRFDPITPWRPVYLDRYEATAREFCKRCPVIVDCAAYADLAGETGLWGGAYRRYPRDGSHLLIPDAPLPGGVPGRARVA